MKEGTGRRVHEVQEGGCRGIEFDTSRHGTAHGNQAWVDTDLKPLTLNPCW
jgi:hypothetical protein